MSTDTIAPPTQIWGDPDRAYRAVETRDRRFDGRFITAVRTTGIYCRPSCPAMTPRRRNTEFFATAAAAQSAGYRACRRCLPDAVPGSPEWNLRSDLAARAMRLIADGEIERNGVTGLAQRLGYSQRQLTRVLTTEVGAGPLALARAHRAQAARALIETTRLPFADVAFAAGFASIRQFNDTIKGVFASTPSQLRARDHIPSAGAGTIRLRLAFRAPMDTEGLFRFLGARAISGMESVTSDGYARTLRLPHGPAIAYLTPAPSYIDTSLRLTDLRDLGTAVARLRRLLDLDADPVGVDEALARDPALTPLVAMTPGIRVPGSVDGPEIVLRALLGQQVSVAAARTALGRLTSELGERLRQPDGELSMLFPLPSVIAERGAEVLRGPARRVASVLAVSAALADGSVDVHIGRDAEELRAELEALPGVGPWTAGYVLMRVLGSPDVLLTSDLVLRHGAETIGLPSQAAALLAHSRQWQPWRSYAGMHLWRAASAAPKATSRTVPRRSR